MIPLPYYQYSIEHNIYIYFLAYDLQYIYQTFFSPPPPLQVEVYGDELYYSHPRVCLDLPQNALYKMAGIIYHFYDKRNVVRVCICLLFTVH
jgi:hypothetical protein